jgi:hypothetical protein
MRLGWDEWEATYVPTPNPLSDEEEQLWQAYYEKADEIPKDVSPNRIWTLVDGEGIYTHIKSGKHHLADGLGFFVTDVPWAEEVFVTNQGHQGAQS